MEKRQFHFRRAVKLSVSSATRGGEKGRRNSHGDKKVDQVFRKKKSKRVDALGVGGGS